MFVKPAYSSEPLCKFGPGGDFVAVWPGPAAGGSPALRLLAAVVEAAAVILGLKQSAAWQGLSPALVGGGSRSGLSDRSDQSDESDRRGPCRLGPQERSRIEKEIQIHATENSRAFRAPDPSPAPASKDGRRLPGEPMLFPDVRRNGVRIEHKPKHRIRAYRGAAKKGPSVRLCKQSTLFDAQFGSARIA